MTNNDHDYGCESGMGYPDERCTCSSKTKDARHALEAKTKKAVEAIKVPKLKFAHVVETTKKAEYSGPMADHYADWDCCDLPYAAHLKPAPRMPQQPRQLTDYLIRYVVSRGIDMPYYTHGHKIVEEASELQEAVVSGDIEAIMDETADVIITALVCAHQFGFRAEDALIRKILKDKGRGLKKDDQNHES